MTHLACSFLLIAVDVLGSQVAISYKPLYKCNRFELIEI